jgi:hypothetical protein
MPGFFGDQADRLLRKQWTDPFELAQELWAMFNADVPMTTDQPIIQTRNNDNVPATQIIDNTDGSSSPIVINKTDGDPSPQPNVNSNGDYSCCGSSSQNQPPKPPQDPSKDPFPPPGTVTGAPGGTPPTDPNTPYRQFLGTVTIKIVNGPPDVFHFNGLDVVFVAIGCFPYKPPTIPKPSSPFDPTFKSPNGTILEQIAEFMAKWSLDGYTITSQSVGDPGGVCTP